MQQNAGNRAVLVVLGVLFVLASLGGAAVAVERHMAFSESMARSEGSLEEAKAAYATGDREELEKSVLLSDWDLSHAARQSGERNMFGAGALGGVWVGAAFLVLAFRRKAPVRSSRLGHATQVAAPFVA